jgi:hypothetical protein
MEGSIHIGLQDGGDRAHEWRLARRDRDRKRGVGAAGVEQSTEARGRLGQMAKGHPEGDTTERREIDCRRQPVRESKPNQLGRGSQHCQRR